MIGNKTVADLLNNKYDALLKELGNETRNDVLVKKLAISDDYKDCQKELEEYTNWYNNDYTVASLGQAVEEFNLYE